MSQHCCDKERKVSLVTGSKEA